jgi:hypothetical protein
MATRLLWDAEADAVALRDTYYRDAFGPAAASIQALAEEWAAKPELSRPNLSRWWATIDAASAAVGSNAALSVPASQTSSGTGSI